jgi:hypothetical protein
MKIKKPKLLLMLSGLVVFTLFITFKIRLYSFYVRNEKNRQAIIKSISEIDLQNIKSSK